MVYQYKFLSNLQLCKAVKKPYYMDRADGGEGHNFEIGNFSFKDVVLPLDNCILFSSNNDKLVPAENTDRYKLIIKDLKVINQKPRCRAPE